MARALARERGSGGEGGEATLGTPWADVGQTLGTLTSSRGSGGEGPDRQHKFLSGQVNTKQWVRCTLAEATCNGASQCIRCENLSISPRNQYRTVQQPCCKGWVDGFKFLGSPPETTDPYPEEAVAEKSIYKSMCACRHTESGMPVQCGNLC